jgi:hypothetical protein
MPEAQPGPHLPFRPDEPASGSEPDRPDHLAADLARLVSEARSADAVRARARERSLRQQATADATVTGLLLDLAEEQAELTICTAAGRIHQGRVTAVGRDFAVVQTAAGDACVVLQSVATVRRSPRHWIPDTTGDRPAPRAVSLAAHLAGIAPLRPRVAIVTSGELNAVVGELRSVGQDVATVVLDGDPPTSVYVALGSVSEVLVSG